MGCILDITVNPKLMAADIAPHFLIKEGLKERSLQEAEY